MIWKKGNVFKLLHRVSSLVAIRKWQLSQAWRVLPCQCPSLVLSLIVPHSAFKRQLMFDVSVSIYKAKYCPGIFWPLKKKKKRSLLADLLKIRIPGLGLHTLSHVTFAIILHRDEPKTLHWKQSLKAGLGVRVHLAFVLALLLWAAGLAPSSPAHCKM